MITKTLLTFLTAWIIENTEFSEELDPPNFVSLNSSQMSDKACFSSDNCRVKAYYVKEEGIYIIDELKPSSNVCHKSIILHELIHHYQKNQNKSFDLDEHTLWTLQERQAIFYQNVFLYQQKKNNGMKGPENVIHCEGGSYLDLQYKLNEN
tara:strand:+ start:102 stop:554 length:453 start_codon:yes stop_codon:yes gene_type:complete